MAFGFDVYPTVSDKTVFRHISERWSRSQTYKTSALCVDTFQLASSLCNALTSELLLRLPSHAEITMKILGVKATSRVQNTEHIQLPLRKMIHPYFMHNDNYL